MEDKPRVTLIGTLPPIKGISPYCHELLKSLSVKNKVEFIGFKKLYPDFLYPGGDRFKDKDFKQIKFKNAEIRNILTYYNPFSWLWAGLTAKGGVVHAQWWSHVLAPAYITMLSIAKLRKKKIILTVHNVVPHESTAINRLLNASVMYFGDRFIVHNKNNREELSKRYDIAKEKITVIPHGILIPVPIKGIKKSDARRYLNIQDDKKVILFFGNIREYKGLDDLINAMADIVKEVPEALLVIAGKPWKKWDKYEKIICKNNLENYIYKKLDFIKPTEVEYYFQSCDLVVLPYKYFDSQTGVGALALPFKKALLVTDVGGLTDFVKDEGAIVKPNSKDLSKKITKLLKDKKALDKLSDDSKFIAEEYIWDEISAKTNKLCVGLK